MREGDRESESVRESAEQLLSLFFNALHTPTIDIQLNILYWKLKITSAFFDDCIE